MLKKGLAVVILVLFLGISIIPDVIGDNSSFSKTIYVDDDAEPPYDGTLEHPFKKIQDGIDVSVDGDTVYVYGGIYYENVVIDKSISLTGEDRNSTIIDGGGNDDVIYISAIQVNISGFTIQKSGGAKNEKPTYFDYNAGIDIRSSYSIISDNIISNNNNGILIEDSVENTIIDNEIVNNGRMGVQIWGNVNGYQCIKDNIIAYNQYGIWGKNAEVSGNTVTNNIYGMVLTYDDGICKIYENIVGDNDWGGITVSSNQGVIYQNTVFNNLGSGLHIIGNENQIFENSLTNNDNGGVGVFGSYNNISSNDIRNNDYGIRLQPTYYYPMKNNVIYKNNFIGNKRHALFENDNIQIIRNKNTWNSNYWDDYESPPKPIFGKIIKTVNGPFRLIYLDIPILLVLEFDWHPAQEPYDIP